MKNRKSVMALSGLLILFFHLWINLTGSKAEFFIQQTAYIGVDLFFFLSAFSLAGRRVDNYWSFIFSRFKKVYIRYIIFALIAFVYSGWTIVRLLKVISGIELFEKGGGAFLWFLPAIMIFYILFPLLDFCDSKNRIITALVALSLWLATAAVMTYFLDSSKLFIIINRIPIFLVGYYFRKLDLLSPVSSSRFKSIILGSILTLCGYFIAYNTAYQIKLNVPFRDMFYVCLIPACIGIVILADLIPEFKVISLLGSSTLELYAIQMIFGYKYATKILKFTGNSIATNLIVFITLICAAILVSKCYTALENAIYTIRKQ